MSILSDIPKHARKVVQAANRRGQIDNEEFTMAMARREVCKSMDLEEGALDEKDKRNAVKQAVQDALNSLGNDDEDDAGNEEGEQDEEEEEEVEAPKPKSKSKSATKPKASTKSKPSSSRRKSVSKADPDDDDDDENDEDVSEESDDDGDKDDSEVDEEEYVESEEEKPKRKRATKATAPAKKVKFLKKSRRDVESADEGEIDSGEEDEERPPVKQKTRSTSTPAESPAPSSPMSSVYDEPPAKRRESGGKKGNGTEKKKERKESAEGLSPDEERVAELKKIVNACGVRKQWAKEFAECPTVSHLLSLLSSLGMKGTPTLGKARSVKQKRELAAELDDVKEFEAVRGRASDTGRTRRTARRVNYAVDSDGSGGEEPPKDSAAMAAVMDFLDDEDSDADSD